MKFPETIEDLRVQSYQFVQHARCRGANCTAKIEWWQTPSGKHLIPLDVDSAGKVTPHWANCPNAKDFRK